MSRYSYGVYLIHPVFLIMTVYFGVPFVQPSPILKLLWALPVTIVVVLIIDKLISIAMKRIDKMKHEAFLRGLFTTLISLMWLYTLRGINGSVLTYIIVSVIAVIMSTEARGRINKVSVNITIVIFSVLFSALTVLGNYYIYTQYAGRTGLIWAFTTFVTGFIVFYNIWKCGYVRLKDYTFKPRLEHKVKSIWVFIGTCTAFIVFNILILVFLKYPGDYMFDTLWQLDEIKRGEYTNHHSVYHTWLLALFVKLGYSFFSGLSSAIFMYLIFQIIVVGLIVGYFIKTLYEMRAPILNCFCRGVYND